jgi:hypothetical protein
MQDDSLYWRRNMYVCLVGSFTNVMAMTLLLPFLPVYGKRTASPAFHHTREGRGCAYGRCELGVSGHIIAVAPAPGEQLVGIEVVPAGHDRDRRTARACLRHGRALHRLRPAPAPPHLSGVHFPGSGHLRYFTAHAAQPDEGGGSPTGAVHRTLAERRGCAHVAAES